MFASQGNTQSGVLPKIASGAITAGYLVKLTTGGKVTAVSAVADKPQFVAAHNAADGETVACIPLDPAGNVRIKAGTVVTGTSGAAVYLAAIPTAPDGRINEISTSATKIGTAEEDYVTGQLVLIRPISPQ